MPLAELGFHSGAGVQAWLAVAGILAYMFATATYRRRIA
jgi:hypothetical protein